MILNKISFSSRIAAIVLILIISSRMFCLFIATPILALHINDISNFTTTSIIWFGIAMGGYGLMQIFFQIPSGILSDHIGRVSVMVIGFTLFVTGSIICEISHNVNLFAIGRLIQGIGAVSASSTALLADLTPVEHRFRWMALMGVGISLAFIFSFLLGPKLYAHLSFKGFFLIPAYIAAISIFLLAFFPKEMDKGIYKNQKFKITKGKIKNYLAKASVLFLFKDIKLLHLNLGVFFLHAMMIGIFVAIPTVLTHFHRVALNNQWSFYIFVVPPALLSAFLFIWFAQKFKQLKLVIALLVFLILVSIWLLSTNFTSYLGLIVILLFFFFGFSCLEALQPALVSKVAPINRRGSAMGIYHTFQSLGLFFGGFTSSLVYSYFGVQSVFLVNAALAALWLSLAVYNFIFEKNQ